MERVKEHFCWIKAAPLVDRVAETRDKTLMEARSHGLDNVRRAFAAVKIRMSMGSVGGNDAPHALRPDTSGGEPGLEPPDRADEMLERFESQGNEVTSTHRPVPTPKPSTMAFERFEGVGETMFGEEIGSVHRPPPTQTGPVVGRGGRVRMGGAGGTERLYAGADFMGAWHLLAGSPLESELGMSLAAIVGTEQDAYDWIASQEGVAWSQDAVLLQLMCFSAIGNF